MAEARAIPVSFHLYRILVRDVDMELVAGVPRARISTSQENIFDDARGAPARSAARASSSQKAGLLGVRANPGESISARLASLHVKETRVTSSSSTRSDVTRTSSNLNAGAKNAGSSLKRAASTISIPSSKTRDTARSKIPVNEDEDMHADLSSPDLPMDPITPVSSAQNFKNQQAAGMTAEAQETRVMAGEGRARTETTSKGLGKNGAAKSSGSKDKGKGKAVDVEAAHDADACTKAEEDEEGAAQQARERELSMQVSPRRPTASTWVPSPLRPSNTFPMHSGASGAYELFRGLIADMQAKNHADVKALHLDMLRMGRGLRQEMKEWGEEVTKLREENVKLREENERLRKGH